MTTQSGWRYCNACRELYFVNSPHLACAAGGTHADTDSDNYSLQSDVPDAQAGWRWCMFCSCLYLGTDVGQSHCPGRKPGGPTTHQGETTGPGYSLLENSTAPNMQSGWMLCGKCKGIFLTDSGKGSGACPAGDLHSVDPSSANYSIHVLTPAEQATESLTNMQALNDYIYQHSNALIQNAYLLLTIPDDTDPGATVLTSLFSGTLAGLGSLLGPVGKFASGFLSGMMTSWETNPPPSLNTTFASLYLRLSATAVEVDKQLASYINDLEANWDTSFTYEGIEYRVSDLGTGDIFPAETDPEFLTVATAALHLLDQTIWTLVLKAHYVVTQIIQTPGEGQYNTTPITIAGPESAFPDAAADTYIQQNQAQYVTPISWHPSMGCASEDGWYVNQYVLGTGVTGMGYNPLNDQACQYLMTNYYSGTVQFPDGLFDRNTVFFGLGLPLVQVDSNVARSVAATTSMTYKRALISGDTLGHLILSEGRDAVEARIIERAQQDWVFATMLSRNPRETLEGFLGVRIPENIGVNVVVESESSSFGLVVPRHELPLANYELSSSSPTE